MKLSDYARKIGVNYKTAWNWFKSGKLPNARQLPSGTIIVEEKPEVKAPENVVAIYKVMRIKII